MLIKSVVTENKNIDSDNKYRYNSILKKWKRGSPNFQEILINNNIINTKLLL
jgi:hypothetical protein